MSELPKGWRETTLDSIGKWSSGGTPKRTVSEYYNGDIPWLVIGDLNDGYVTSARNSITKIGLERSSAKLIEPNSLLIAMYGSIGKLGINKIRCATNQAIAACSIDESVVNLKFLFYFLMSQRKQLLLRGKGGAQQNISQTVLKAYKISLPILEEQKRIADKLDSVLAKVEAAQARLDKIPAILKRFRQSVLAAATSGELTKEWRDDEPYEETAITLLAKLQGMRKDLYIEEITRGNKETKRLSAKVKNHSPVLPTSRLPKGWAWTSFMSSMLKVVDCHNKTAPYIESGIPLIRTTDIRDGVISLKGAKFISQETYEFWARRCPPEPGDIIFTREAPMGEAGVVPDDTRLCMGQRMMLLRPAPEYVLAKYVVFNTLSLDFKERMNRQAIGSGVKHLRVADVEALTFPLPLLKEQKEIVRRIEKLFEEASLVENQYNAAKARLDNLTQSILARAFKGELLTKPVESEITEIENSVEALNA